MSNKLNSFYNIRTLEELSEQKTCIHNINATVKVLITLVFLIITISFDKYDLSAIVPLIFYPIIIMTLADMPLLDLAKRTIIAMPLIIGVGIFNPIIDTEPMISLSWINISGGWVSFISIIIKGILTISGAQLLIGTTGMTKVALSLRTLKVPKIFVVQLLFTYRYIFIFLEEIGRSARAYSLRSYKSKGIRINELATLLGGLLMRTLDRAERIYRAMSVRGFTGEYYIGKENKLMIQDVIYFLGWTAYFIFIRYYNVAEFIGAFINNK